MNNTNIVIVRGNSYQATKEALQKWIGIYEEDLRKDIAFQLCQCEQGKQIINVDKRVDNYLFFALVNNLSYPENKIYAEGFCMGGKELNTILQGKLLQVYVSDGDEYDNVLVTTSGNEHFLVNFDGKIRKETSGKPFCPPSINETYPYETLSVAQSIKPSSTKRRPSQKLIRLFILMPVVLSAFAWLLFAATNDVGSFLTCSIFAMVGTNVAYALFYDKYPDNKTFVILLSCSLFLLLYQVVLLRYCPFYPKVYCAFYAILPLTLLLQWIMRPLCVAIFYENPSLGERNGTVADFVYNVLILAALVLSILYIRKKLDSETTDETPKPNVETKVYELPDSLSLDKIPERNVWQTT